MDEGVAGYEVILPATDKCEPSTIRHEGCLAVNYSTVAVQLVEVSRAEPYLLT